MKLQKQLIHTKKWDVLLVLDAIRFDFFKRYYEEYIPGGKLIKCISRNTFTFGWIMDTFGRNFDATFVCTEPVTDSIHDINNKVKHGNTIDVNKYFSNVIDLYNYEWKKPGLIYPEPVFNMIIHLLNKGEKRIVAKFIQVHDPYIYWLRKGYNGCKYKQIIKGNFRKVLYELISDELYWTILKKFNFPPENWLNYLWLKEGRSGIIKGYCEDLIMMMNKCKTLIEQYPEKSFVITADHGERLGEYGRYSHGGRRDKLIKEVPWYEIKGKK